ncbi:hypothetical protein [Sphingobium sp.]|uniref:hypothetical protein n=1 Tax=Sphingobium sp. TaxID=1912891 RepID=UPI003BB7B5C7
MQTLNKRLATVVLVTVATLLMSCSPRPVEIQACLVGEKLAFHVENTRGWFSDSVARPWSVSVFEYRTKSAWETKVPYGLAENREHTYQPQRSIILYGDRYAGWEIPREPEPLSRGKAYVVTIWSDGGQGMLDMVYGTTLPPCPDGSESP